MFFSMMLFLFRILAFLPFIAFINAQSPSVVVVTETAVITTSVTSSQCGDQCPISTNGDTIYYGPCTTTSTPCGPVVSPPTPTGTPFYITATINGNVYYLTEVGNGYVLYQSFIPNVGTMFQYDTQNMLRLYPARPAYNFFYLYPIGADYFNPGIGKRQTQIPLYSYYNASSSWNQTDAAQSGNPANPIVVTNFVYSRTGLYGQVSNTIITWWTPSNPGLAAVLIGIPLQFAVPSLTQGLIQINLMQAIQPPIPSNALPQPTSVTPFCSQAELILFSALAQGTPYCPTNPVVSVLSVFVETDVPGTTTITSNTVYIPVSTTYHIAFTTLYCTPTSSTTATTTFTGTPLAHRGEEPTGAPGEEGLLAEPIMVTRSPRLSSPDNDSGNRLTNILIKTNNRYEAIERYANPLAALEGTPPAIKVPKQSQPTLYSTYGSSWLSQACSCIETISSVTVVVTSTLDIYQDSTIISGVTQTVPASIVTLTASTSQTVPAAPSLHYYNFDTYAPLFYLQDLNLGGYALGTVLNATNSGPTVANNSTFIPSNPPYNFTWNYQFSIQNASCGTVSLGSGFSPQLSCLNSCVNWNRRVATNYADYNYPPCLGYNYLQLNGNLNQCLCTLYWAVEGTNSSLFPSDTAAGTCGVPEIIIDNTDDQIGQFQSGVMDIRWLIWGWFGMNPY